MKKTLILIALVSIVYACEKGEADPPADPCADGIGEVLLANRRADTLAFWLTRYSPVDSAVLSENFKVPPKITVTKDSLIVGAWSVLALGAGGYVTQQWVNISDCEKTYLEFE